MLAEQVAADRWLSVQEVANHLGVSRETIYSWIKTKEMPAHRVGRHWRFKKRDVDEWVRQSSTMDADEDLRSVARR